MENFDYNYGVPVQQQQQHNQGVHTRNRHKVVNAKKTKPAQTNVEAAPKLTADIYVFARKRPKLACEAKFNDVVVVENGNERQPQNEFICVNEMKLAVDGTPILRKVILSNFIRVF